MPVELPGSYVPAPGQDVVANSLDVGAGKAKIDSSGNATVNSLSVGSNTPVLADGVTPTPSGISTGKFWDQGGAVYNVNAWGARADKRTVADAAILTGTPNLSSASASFINLPVAQGGDVGKLAEVVGAAAAGLTLITTILSVQSPTSATLAANAGTSVSGATADIATDDRVGTLLAIAAMGTAAGILYFASHRYSMGSTIQTNQVHLTVMGTGRTSGGTAGTIIEHAGTGPLFDLGTDNGLAYDGNYYDGVQGFSVRDCLLIAARADTALDNGQGFYRPGTIAVRDWRGGDERFDNVTIANFDYAFWGIQSDVNRWDHVEINYCHSGVYAGPRSDQFTFYECYWIYNDRAVDVDRSTPRFDRCIFGDNGAVGTNPIRLRSAWTWGQWGADFDNCWFEQYLGVAADLEAFIEIGVGDAVQSSQLTIRKPTILTNPHGSGPHMQNFIKVGNATNIRVEEPTAQIFTAGAPGSANGLDALISCVAANSPDIALTMPSAYVTTNFSKVVASGGATPNTLVEAWGGAVGKQITSGTMEIGSSTRAAGVALRLNSAAGQNRDLDVYTGNSLRWAFRYTNDPETGSDAGTNFQWITRHDDGSINMIVLTITRATGQLTWGDAVHFAFGTTTGTKLGLSTAQKLAFHNSTPVIQRAGAAQVAVGTTASTQATPFGFTTGAQADGIVALVNELRAALVEKGLIKGAA